MEMIRFQQLGILGFWLTSASGVVLGSLLGLLVCLRLQSFRKNRPNQPVETTRGTGP